MTGLVLQLNILGVNAKRRPSTPRQYREDFIARIEAARLVAGMEREQVVDALCKRTGLAIKLDTYKKWESRALLPHHLIIPFCDVTGADPYMILTGVPFKLGRAVHTAHRSHAA